MAVKQDGEVGLAYMKSFGIEEKIRQEGIEEGRLEGEVNGKSAHAAGLDRPMSRL